MDLIYNSFMSKVIENDTLYLSPSSINTFLNCPRKYYLQNLLGLKQETTFSATYGLVLHAIFEVFNSTCLNSYDAKTFLNLANAFLFNRQKADDLGFKEFHLEVIQETDILKLQEIRLNIEEAVAELELSGFFNKIPKKIHVEVPFKFELPELQNVVLNGRIDAIYEWEDGFEVIDYKSGADKFKTLEYFISDYGVRFEGASGQYKGVFNENNVNKYQYQIPIYYLACQSLPQFRDKIKNIGLIYIRPKSKHDGFKTDFINPKEIELRKSQIIENLDRTVVQEIRAREGFEPKVDKFNCDYCSYGFLCEEPNECLLNSSYLETTLGDLAEVKTRGKSHFSPCLTLDEELNDD